MVRAMQRRVRATLTGVAMEATVARVLDGRPGVGACPSRRPDDRLASILRSCDALVATLDDSPDDAP